MAGFRISGNSVFTAAELLALIASWTGADRTLSDLEAAAGRITQYYRAHGYLIARAFVPAQDVGDGIVTKQSKPEAQGYYVFALPKSDSRSKKKGE